MGNLETITKEEADMLFQKDTERESKDLKVKTKYLLPLGVACTIGFSVWGFYQAGVHYAAVGSGMLTILTTWLTWKDNKELHKVEKEYNLDPTKFMEKYYNKIIEGYKPVK